MSDDVEGDDAMRRFEELATKIFQADKPQKPQIECEDENPDEPIEQE